MTDFVHELELELLAAARRRAVRRPYPRLAWRPIAIAAAAAAVLVAAVLTLRPGDPRPPANPKPGAFVPPLAAPIEACDGTRPPALPTTFRPIAGHPPQEVSRALAVLRRPHDGSDRLVAIAPPLRTWLPVGEYDPNAVRRASVPATYVVPTSDLRTKPPACGAGESRGPGACLVMPGRFACFTLAEIRAGRALARNGRHLIGIAPDGVSWVRLNATLGALAVDNVFEQTPNGDPLSVAFEHDRPRVTVLNATRAPRIASRLAKTLGRVFGNRAIAGNAARRAATTIVLSRRPQDDVLAGAIACYLGASSTGSLSAASRPDVPDDADFVVVLGERM